MVKRKMANEVKPIDTVDIGDLSSFFIFLDFSFLIIIFCTRNT